jgi:hypothetical protein
MSDWFWMGLWGGIGYAMSGFILTGGILCVLMCYAFIRILLDYLNIKKWKA